MCAYFHILNLSCLYSVDFLSLCQHFCFWMSCSVTRVTAASHTRVWWHVTNYFSVFIYFFIFISGYYFQLCLEVMLLNQVLVRHLPLWMMRWKNDSDVWRKRYRRLWSRSAQQPYWRTSLSHRPPWGRSVNSAQHKCHHAITIHGEVNKPSIGAKE